MLLHIVSVCPMFRRCRSLKRYIAISSLFLHDMRNICTICLNILGKKQPWNWGKMGFLPRMLVGSRSVTRRREREKSLYTYQQKTVRGSREGWARHFLSHAIPFIIEFVSASRRCGIKIIGLRQGCSLFRVNHSSASRNLGHRFTEQ